MKCALPAGDMNLGLSRVWKAAIRIGSWQGREGTGWSLGEEVSEGTPRGRSGWHQKACRGRFFREGVTPRSSKEA